MNILAILVALLTATSLLSATGVRVELTTGITGAAPSARSPALQPGGRAAPGGAGTWLWPVEPRPEVLEEFRAPATRYGPGHRGLDLEASPGVQIRAPADGVVAFAGTVVDRPVVSVEHAGGVRSTFEPAQSLVPVGDLVARGQPLAVVAAGGHCTDRCLHLGARLNGGYVNPRLLLSGIPRAVLLPVGYGGSRAGPVARGRRGVAVRRGGVPHGRRPGGVRW